MELLAVLVILGLVAGFASGLLGIGGGLVTVPVLTFLGFAPSHAIATSVFVVLGTSVVGAAQHARLGNVDTRLGMQLALGALPGALVGAYGLSVATDSAVRYAFVALLLILAALMARKRANRAPLRFSPPFFVTPGIGLGAGVLAGLFGIGGGVLMVPAQSLLFGVAIHRAIGTSLLVIVLASAFALMGHTLFDSNIGFVSGAWIIAGGIAGAPLGARLAVRLPERPLRLGFAAVLLALGVGMLS